jgi:hypothetical protein
MPIPDGRSPEAVPESPVLVARIVKPHGLRGGAVESLSASRGASGQRDIPGCWVVAGAAVAEFEILAEASSVSG